MDIDGIKMTRTLNTVREAVTREQLRINATSLALEAIRSHMDGERERVRFEGDVLIEEMIMDLVDSCKNLLLRMEYQEKRVQSQTTVVSPVHYWLKTEEAHSHNRYTNSWRKKIQKL